MTYEEWEAGVPAEITGDLLWRIEAYRLALFVSDIGWADTTRLVRDPRTVSLADQLYRSLGSVSANIEEGYSRGTGRDRARFYEYALGSAGETRGWYYRARHVLGERVAMHRVDLMTQIIRLLLAMVPHQRGGGLREDEAPYPAATALPARPVPFAPDRTNGQPP